MLPLFEKEENRTLKQIPITDGELILYPNFFSSHDAHEHFSALLKGIPWRQEKITLYGKTHNVPRLSAWHGDEGLSYNYSGILHEALPWTEALLHVKNELESELKIHFNSVLANLYRDGNDKVGWHADNEKELGQSPVIASVSFGASRRFDLKHLTDKHKRLQLWLNSGDLLVMKGQLQHYWHHQVPMQKKITEPRINLTFRQVFRKA